MGKILLLVCPIMAYFDARAIARAAECFQAGRTLAGWIGVAVCAIVMIVQVCVVFRCLRPTSS